MYIHVARILLCSGEYTHTHTHTHYTHIAAAAVGPTHTVQMSSDIHVNTIQVHHIIV